MSERTALEELITTLKQQRDELQVKMHLANEEAKEEYNRLTERINQISDQYQPVKEASTETAQNVIAALKLAAEEMSIGLSRVWKSLK